MPIADINRERTMSSFLTIDSDWDLRFTDRQRRRVLLPLLLAFPAAVLVGAWLGAMTGSKVPPVALPVIWLITTMWVIERKA
jgi:hypothetical protein